MLDNANIDSPLDEREPIPLVVDLDGTLIRTDLLYESYFASATLGVRHHWATMRAFARGKAPLKAFLAGVGPVDYAVLPYNEDVLAIIRAAKAQGRKVYLATASDERHAAGVAAHLGLFDGVFASDGASNLSAREKARVLVERFGSGNFDYIGNSSADIPAWEQARKAYVVAPSGRLVRRVERLGVETEHTATAAPTLRTWLKALRVHQYSKNTLIFVPLLTAHVFDASSIARALLAFIAFSLCASAAYLINDLIDLDSDRKHPSKSRRPFASGAIPVAHGVVAIPLLLVLAFGGALATSLPFFGMLLAYLALTLAYSFTLKRRLIVDIVVLAMLYTMRVVAGAVAISVEPSAWLLAFSMFVFTCLALVKRYTELVMRIDRELPDPSNRNYRLIDLPIVGALAAASGLNAVTIFALYVSSPEVRIIYHRPEILWLICPILLYWLSRIVILAHRRAVDDDPIVFALHDRNSLVCGVAAVCVLVLASWM